VGNNISIIGQAGFEDMLKKFCGKELDRTDASSIVGDSSLHGTSLLSLEGNALVYGLNLGP